MENLSHSFSKKSYGGNGLGMASHGHKSVYDDVFGGPPKFGMPTLAPRLEDYTEIFGGFHSARGSSIPILDLPVVDEAELCCDVRSSRFDYSEVFGGFNGLDFTVSFEDLVRKAYSGDDPSDDDDDDDDDDTWTPAQSNYLSDESDPSICSERSHSLADANIHNEASGIRQFDVSYHKANQRSNEVSDVATHKAELRAIPGHTYAIDQMHASQKVDGSKLRPTGDLKSSVDFGGRAVDDEQFKNNIAVPKKCGNGTSESHSYHVEKPDGRFFPQSRPFVTVNDINLRTKPSHLPPPSRPPPVFTLDKPNSNLKASKTCNLEQECDSWPSFYDVKVDGNSSMTASAAVRDAMEKAQAKIRSAKESMEKQEVLQSSLKLHSENDIKEEKLSKTFDGSKDGRVQGKSAKQDSRIKLLAEEERNKIKMNQELSDLVEREASTDLMEKPAKRRFDKHSSSSYPVFYNSEGNFAWRQGTEYFEVFEAQIPFTVFEHNRDDNILLQMDSDEFKHCIVAETTEQLGGVKEFKAAEMASTLEDKKIKIEVAAETFGQRLRAETTAESSCQTQSEEKANVGINNCESEGSKGKMKMVKQHEDSRKIGNVTNKSVQMNTKADLHVAEVAAKSHLRGVSERPDTDKIVMDVHVHARKPNDGRSRENFEMNYCARLDKAVKQDGNEKGETNRDEKKKQQQEEYHESQKDERKQEEVCGRKENQSVHKEDIKSEDDEKRLKGAIEHAENEKDFKKSFEKSENKRSQELDCLIEKDNGRLRETSNLVDSEKDFELTPSHNHEEGRSDACEPGRGKVKVEEVREQEDNNNGSNTVFVEDVEDISIVANASEKNIHVSEEADKHEELCGHAKDAEQSMGDDKDKQGNLDQVTNLPRKGEDIKAFVGTGKVTDEMNAPPLPGKLDRNCGELETIQESISCKENDFPTGAKDGELRLHSRVANLLVEEKSNSFGKNQDELRCQKLEKGTVNVNNSPYLHEHGIDSNEAGIGIGSENSSLHDKEVFRRACDPQTTAVASHEQGWRVKMNDGVQISVNKESLKDNVRPCQPCMDWADNVQVIGAGSSTVCEDRENACNAGQRCSQNVERKEKSLNETVAQEDNKEEERLQKEKEELLRKMEEEREREREREKDRMATLEARDRSYVEARGRAERAAVERAAAEARQRAMVEAREKLEKASLEARERSLPDKASAEARIRAERAAVERATLEARQRAFEKAMADKVSFETRERVERSVSDKYSASSRTVEMRQSSSFRDQPDFHSQSSGTSNVLRYSYSAAHAGLEGESPQRCKARLERYRRTAERAAKALAEKNMRDLLAQREQAERNKLAETLDAEVKRWSSGKEGNLRALLSTLQYILGPDCGWQPIPLTEVITSAAVKKAYRKATLCVHPDKLQQRGASIQQKYICEKVFDLLKEAWNIFNSEEW